MFVYLLCAHKYSFMKRVLLLLFITSFCLATHAQKIYFTDTSNIWKELQPQYNDNDPWILNYYSYSFTADTTFDSLEYRNFGFGWIRDDTASNQVYLRSADSDIVLMNYNLNVGDTFVGPYYKFPVLKVDSTLINSVWHKVWYFPFYDGGWYSSTDTIFVVEGIGCLEDPLFMVTDYSGCVECGQPFIYCFSNDSITPALSPTVAWLDNSTSCATFPHLGLDRVHANNNEIQIYPNPANNDLYIIATRTIQRIVISNTLGQPILDRKYSEKEIHVDLRNFSAGLYFIKVNGRTVSKLIKQ